MARGRWKDGGHGESVGLRKSQMKKGKEKKPSSGEFSLESPFVSALQGEKS